MHAFPLTAALLGFLAAAPAAPAQEPAATPHCATFLEAQRRADGRISGQSVSARTQAATLSARTLLTEHFALHYTLSRSSVHQPRWDVADSALRRRRDSVLAALPPSLGTFRRDSSLHALLDTLHAPPPLYVTRAAQYFEKAYAYYDSLGMRMPGAGISTVFLASSQGKFTVDIADIGTATGNNGALYGLTYPRPDSLHFATIVMENDFLWNAQVNAGTGDIMGTPVTAYINGQARQYDVEWDMGLHVTASHEFYHAVQFTYIPVLPDFIHAWYELSATAMEERLAPSVNDYLQYLRYIIPANARVSLFIGPSNENYGNSIFHSFLTRALGAGFDAPVWERLRNNGNKLDSALLGEIGPARWDSLYSAYSAALALSGLPGTASSPLAFSPDMALWPRPSFDTLSSSASSQFSLPPGTFRLIRPPASGTAGVRLAGFSGSTRVDQQGTGFQSVFFPGNFVPLAKGTGDTTLALAVGNASFNQTRQVLVPKSGAGLAASRNPVDRSEGQVFFLAPEGTSASVNLSVVSESGRRVASLSLDSSTAFWGWNLRDLQNRAVRPGVYYFGVPGQAPKTLLILP